jgi:hypothetical protein
MDAVEQSMQSKKITITISPETTLSDAICKALNPLKKYCYKRGLHQTVNASLAQENIDQYRGKSAYIAAEWRSQIGVMLG